ncbi:serine/threonine protein kinase [Caloranaerobacter azorensis DSM 13643]|uniref:Serine/threonine protein kinase n=1 Tax=Caloranaerobacter azorensis DSM 13643 TaxID=1121264 RepID=A0A1M5SVX0_9FIRM|nr:protein kinase [Caloranaerobacter azorensis]SHH42647.1 serine/threonine protein kinase [Caloranaerobacter azorensis DSM 13643]
MLKRGDRIEGKWYKNEYTILKKIGQGGVGTVYKVIDYEGNIRALKISEDIMSLTREFEILQKLPLLDNIPRVYEIDDWVYRNKRYYYFVMEYIEGNNLKEIINRGKLSIKDILGISLVLLEMMNKLYQLGYIYGDLKLENIIINRRTKKIMFVDFGGVFKKDRCIKEFTPTYDINSWGIENKNLHIERLIFSTTMLIVCLITRREYDPFRTSMKKMLYIVDSLNISEKLKVFIKDGLLNKFNDINCYIEGLKALLIESASNKTIISNDIINLIFLVSICFFVLTIFLGIKFYV